MMTVAINCDDCLVFSEVPTRPESVNGDLDTEIGPGWVHINGRDFCPGCVSRRGLRA
ncbi:hypothetical protein GS896_27645 [Rhodococcus hoagii]|nr:hypothetical protein [Prescottella equi]MBM4654027.1 hypothetical protein [Prescottella equi]MBM4719712.1 hypothetical protein [Prescottella equi]NKR23507.1 hypothetical protein [Prescottella equi]NKT56339.1 hypothetical protein [Prescottella equi]